MLIRFLTLSLVLFVGMSIQVHAQPKDKGREVLDRIRDVRDKHPYEQSTLVMRMTNANGRSRERSLKLWSHTVQGKSRSMLLFESPADVRGTGLLSVSEGSVTAQKLFLPATRRVQTISSSQKGDKFLGSDFTFEDLGEVDHDDFDYTTLSESGTSLTVKAVAKKKGSTSYAWAVHTVDTRRLVLLSSSFHDEAGKPVRELKADQFQEVKPGFWRSNSMVMKDLLKGSQTTLQWKERSFDKISDTYFTERFLQRGAQ
jgi:hypothetical protein